MFHLLLHYFTSGYTIHHCCTGCGGTRVGRRGTAGHSHRRSTPWDYLMGEDGPSAGEGADWSGLMGARGQWEGCSHGCSLLTGLFDGRRWPRRWGRRGLVGFDGTMARGQWEGCSHGCSLLTGLFDGRVSSRRWGRRGLVGCDGNGPGDCGRGRGDSRRVVPTGAPSSRDYLMGGNCPGAGEGAY